MGPGKPEASPNQNAVRAIAWGGLLCGVLDIAYAFALYGSLGVRSLRLLQGIASGLLGRSAFQGGAKTAALGLFLHFLISFTAAAVYYLASRRLGFMVRNAIRSGLLYGVAVYFFMNYVVIPLSAIHRQPFNFGLFLVNLIEHMLLVGLPIALATRKFAGESSERRWKRKAETPNLGTVKSA